MFSVQIALMVSVARYVFALLRTCSIIAIDAHRYIPTMTTERDNSMLCEYSLFTAVDMAAMAEMHFCFFASLAVYESEPRPGRTSRRNRSEVDFFFCFVLVLFGFVGIVVMYVCV